MISVTSTGSFEKTMKFLEKLGSQELFASLERYGRIGVQALSAATPSETGETAHSWDYEVIRSKNGFTISWLNTHENEGVNIAVIIQYGHGTGTGGFIRGRDYINPAMQPIFDQILEDVWKEVINA